MKWNLKSKCKRKRKLRNLMNISKSTFKLHLKIEIETEHVNSKFNDNPNIGI